MKIYCATGNAGKLREFRVAAPANLDIETLPGCNVLPAPEETGDTFEANAILKAKYYGPHAPGMLFADDSGLEVDALGGAPGVQSARFAGPGADDRANNRLLLEKMRGVTNRTARFVCVIALVDGQRLLGTFRAAAEGWIALQPSGDNGFGYDPVFYCPALGCTFGEASPQHKLMVSHRGKAFRQLLTYLAEHRDAHHRSSERGL